MTDPYVIPGSDRHQSGSLRWLLVVVAVVGAGAVAFLVWVAAAFSGGLGDLIDVSTPAPDDRDVQLVRERAVAAARSEVVELEAQLIAAGGGVVLTRAAGETCQKGEHNFKIDHDYDLLCTAREAVVVSSLSPVSLRAALHEMLLAGGWTLRFAAAGDGSTPAINHAHDTGYVRAGRSLSVSDGSSLESQLPTLSGLPPRGTLAVDGPQVALALDVRSTFD